MGRITLVLQAFDVHGSGAFACRRELDPVKQDVKMPQTEKRRVKRTKLARCGCCDVWENTSSRWRADFGYECPPGRAEL